MIFIFYKKQGVSDMKKHIFYGLKLILALVLAFIILNVICFFYYNVPIHAHSETGSTDYVWEKEKFFSRGTEGFAWGVTDSNGFNNLKIFNDGKIDVLVMGSSHVEGFNVEQEENFVSILNEKFKNDNINLNAYNIGVSGHSLTRCLNNVENAINQFSPSKYLIIETSSVRPELNDLKDALSGNLQPLKSYTGGIVGRLQSFPFLRCVYFQLKNASVGEDKQKNPINDEDTYKYLNDLISSSIKKCHDKKIKVIIVYNCSLKVNEYGQISAQDNKDDIEKFERVCVDNKIGFINMYGSFRENYNKEFELPHGFSNSRVGKGHMNACGHRLVSEELYDIIKNIENIES